MKQDTARELRKYLTDVERRLWTALRNRQFEHHKFRRQQPIGPYVVDFVCFEEKLVIELDGGQHGVELNRANDTVRTRRLEADGFRVLRFWNNQLNENFEGVLEIIARELRPKS
jgi:very-short-patch-repair endonuclease